MDKAAPPKGRLFGEIAVAEGLCTREQLEHALAEQSELRKRGIVKTLGAVLHDLDVLSLVQVNQVLEKVDHSRRRYSIEGYEIVSRLGRGGMGAVYLARHLRLQKLVAIKVLKPKLAQNKDYLGRFRREAEATGKLNHPNIVAAFDVGESNGYNYFVMEYVEGETVSAALARSGIIDEARALEILIAIADALHHAWGHGIVHRDIKPANIMVSKQGVPKLCDLGLAIDKTEDRSITRSGVIMGTPYYLSPEQARSDKLDCRSDIYSLGATLFHMVTGCVPFEGETPAVVITKHLNDPVPDPLVINPVLSNGLCYVIARMLAKKPEDRYQTPEELLGDLRELQETRQLPGRRYAPGGRATVAIGPARRRWTRTAAAVLGASALVFGGLALARPQVLVDALAAVRGGGWLADRVRGPIERRREQEREGDRERQAARALEGVEAAIAERPADTQAAREALAAVVRDHDGTQAAQRALARLRAIAARLDGEARSAFFDRAARARTLREAGRFGEARAVLEGFPEELRATSWGGHVQKEIAIVEAAARERLAELEREAAAHADAGRLDAAEAALRPALDLGIEEVVARAETALAALAARAEQERAAATAALAADQAARRDRVLLDVGLAASKDGYPAAAALAARLAESAPEPERPWLAALAADLERIAESRVAELAALRGRRGQAVTLWIGGLERVGLLEDLRDDRVVVRLAPLTRAAGSGAPSAADLAAAGRAPAVGYPLTSLDPGMWLRAERLGEPLAARLAGLVLLLEGGRRGAARALARASDLGEDVAEYRAHLERLGPPD